MSHHARRLLTSLAALLALAAMVVNASANRLSISNQRIRVTWTALKFSNTINTNTVSCPVTLEGSFHSATLPKIVDALVGYITRASVTNSACTGGHATMHAETLPWHIRYDAYSGILPNITLIILELIGFSYEFESGGITCSARSEPSAAQKDRIFVVTSVAQSLTPEPNAKIPLTGGLCPLGRGFLEGESHTLTALGTTTRLSIDLI